MQPKRINRLFFLLLVWCASFVSASATTMYVPIQGTIDIGLAKFIERVVHEANAKGAKHIVIEMNTFGGRIDAATQIKDALLSAKAPVTIYINRRAISAGALISLACDRIVMAPGSSIGAATAVDQSGEKVSEKVQSFMRSEMRSAAEQNGRNARIAEAMVDERIAIENLVDSTQLLTLTADEALHWRIADTILPSLTAVYTSLGVSAKDVQKQEITWSEELVRFLTEPLISSLLLTIGFLGLVFEVKTAGWGIGGTIGAVALMLFFSTNIIAELASVTELLILGAGVALLLIEIFVIPGFGVTGIVGIALIGWALFHMLLGDYPTARDFQQATLGVALSVIGLLIGFIALLRFIPKSRVWNKIALGTQLSQSMGVRSSAHADDLVGMEGIAISDLRPAGKIAVGERVLDVVTDGSYTSRNAHVVIIEVVGNRIVVREKPTAPNQSGNAPPAEAS